jgi:hypothetical protein
VALPAYIVMPLVLVAYALATGGAAGQALRTDPLLTGTLRPSQDVVTGSNRSLPAPTDAEDIAADPYPLEEPAPTAAPADFAGTGLPPAPARPAVQPITNAVAPLRSVARPVLPSSLPQLPETGPIPLIENREVEERTEYDPQALQFGSFTADVALRSTLGQSSDDTLGTYVRTDGEAILRSDWERHGADLTIRGGMRRSIDGSDDLLPQADVILNTRLDLSEVDRVGISGFWTLRREDDDSAEPGTSSTGQDIQTLSGSLGYERTAGLIGLGLIGAADRTMYEEGDDRTNTVLSTSLRATLDSGAAVEPFSEVSVFTRIPDAEVDANGYRRRSVGGDAKLGISADTGLIVGEIALGYAVERFDDGRLPDLKGVITEANLIWTPTPLTTVTLIGTTSFEPSQIAGASGSLKRAGTANIAYALQPNITVNAEAGYTVQTYEGIEREVTTTAFRGGAAWRLNPELEVGLTATHEITDSSVAGDDDTETTVEASVTVRR